MAKYIKTYELSLKDRVIFRIGKDEPVMNGTIQDLSDFPDIWVEVGNPKMTYPEYKRYKISINLIEKDIDNEDWCDYDIQFGTQEAMEFVYDDNYERVVIKRANPSLKQDKERSEVVKNLEECLEAFKKNIQLIKNGFRPCNQDWKKAAEPLYKSMTYLLNKHEDLVDMDKVREEN